LQIPQHCRGHQGDHHEKEAIAMDHHVGGFQIADDRDTTKDNAILKIFESIILPTEMSPAPRIAPHTETHHSGAEVPNATNVSPMMRFETPMRQPIRAEESTNHPAA